MSVRKSLFVLLAIFLIVPAVGNSRTWVVCSDGTGDAPTIQAAIDSIAGDDVIELADGIYTGPGNRDLNNREKAFVIRSQSGDPSVCIIDCQGNADDPHTGIYFFGGG
jgi:hypothetical protein